MRARYNVIFWAAIVCLFVVSMVSVWSLLRLHNGVHMRTEVFALQESLDDVLDALQDADNTFLIAKINQNEAGYNDFIDKIDNAKAQIDDLVDLSAQSKDINQEIRNLKSLIEQKIEVSHGYYIRHGTFLKPEVKRVVEVKDDLLLTNTIRDHINHIDELLNSSFEQHQLFVDKYFGLTMAFLVLATLISFVFFFLFSKMVSREITVRAQLVSDLQVAQGAAVVASNLKSQFLATVSHEIRTPLNGIIGMSELIKSRAQGSDLKRYAEVIHSSSRTLLRIVNEILDFSKIEADKIELEIQEVHVADLVESAAELFARRASEKNLSLILNYDPTAQYIVAADGARLAQVLHNLIGNAVKFTDSGFVEIECVVRAQDNQQAQLELTVRDSGVGIPADKAPLLFQPFNQLQNIHSSEGTGLGLAISKRLIDKMGGEISLDSQYKSGAQFWFKVPVRIIRTEKSAASAVPAQKYFGFGFDSTALPHLQRLFKTQGLNFSPLGRIEDSYSLSLDSWLLLSHDRSDELRNDKIKCHRFVLTNPITPSLLKKITLEEPFTDSMAELGAQDKQNLGAGRMILLAEDNPTNQLLAQTQLESLGYRVQTVASGAECLAALENMKYDLILMDCRMPNIDGYEATRKIRERERRFQSARVVIIAMTANAVDGDKEKCLAAGMDDYIAKPFQLDHLHAMINKWMGPSESIDWSVLKELSDKTNRVVAKKLIESFIQTLGAGLDIIKSAQKNEKWAEIASQMHQLKVSAQALGAIHFGKMCKEIEEQINVAGSPSKDLLSNCLSVGEKILTEYKNQKIYS